MNFYSKDKLKLKTSMDKKLLYQFLPNDQHHNVKTLHLEQLLFLLEYQYLLLLYVLYIFLLLHFIFYNNIKISYFVSNI